MVRRRGSALMLAAAIAALLTAQGCAANRSGSAGTQQAVASQFGCCVAADIDAVRYPGETFQVHWIRTEIPAQAGQRPSKVVLDVSLSGGFRNVADLKASAGGDGQTVVKAAPVTTTSAATTDPVSTLTIPPGAEPGWYELTSVVSADGGLLTGRSAIRVADK